MEPTSASIREMTPSLIQTPTGWLAISARTAPINIAVIGATEDDAETSFRESAAAWARLHESPEPGDEAV